MRSGWQLMMNHDDRPRLFDLRRDEALEIHHSPFGSVGRLFRREGIEAVWVKKEQEEIDPDWFSQPMVDLILVVQGGLRVGFLREDFEARVLEPGEPRVFPAGTRGRTYRWPRQAEGPTVFLAVYPRP